MATALLLLFPSPPALLSLSLSHPTPPHPTPDPIPTTNDKSIPKIHFAAFRNGSTIPETQCPVPLDQQPINDFVPFSWAAADFVEYCSRLFVAGASFALLVGLPVAFFGSAGHQSEPVRPSLVAASSGLFVVTLAIVRMYMGWSYVGNRLLSTTVEYEETGSGRVLPFSMSKSAPSDQSRNNLLDPTDPGI